MTVQTTVIQEMKTSLKISPHNHSVTRPENSVISNEFVVSFIYTKLKAIH